MALTEKDMELIQAAMAEAMKCQPCACGLLPDEQHQMGHIYGFVRDIGGDSISRGVEELRENSKFVKRWRAACEKTGNIVLGTVVLGLCGWAALIGGIGVVAWLKAKLGI